MASSTPDVIDLLAGIRAGSFVDRIRAERPETRANAQKSYLALFEPVQEGDILRVERFAVAAFVAGLHDASAVAEFYTAGIVETAGGASLAAAVKAEVEKGRTHGPYGKYPAGPLSVGDTSGLVFEVSDFGRVALGVKLSAALEHGHLLVFRPREASPAALQKLLDAGWSTTAIVTLSQIVSFLAFQIRVITGLAALSRAGEGTLASAAAE
ncbi:CMD domain protein, Avi_7170 family [Rhizobium mongolense subsp. loessense]|uniref:CMD domain protein, Avi_7170 family n=1 Tax=Rhizobium mongolense subsp. loessense TaxID=158890 RepID=A0A1G4TMB4_9HYPH|nr:CMD domain protein [Rhizobium mongolense]SCW82526.1 CMD domain protein, Avi_7170 family [Rhizobium mongolense subsp. loessense]